MFDISDNLTFNMCDDDEASKPPRHRWTPDEEQILLDIVNEGDEGRIRDIIKIILKLNFKNCKIHQYLQLLSPALTSLSPNCS